MGCASVPRHYPHTCATRSSSRPPVRPTRDRGGGSEASRPRACSRRCDVSDSPEQARLARTVEALLFLASDSLSVGELAEATQASEQEIAGAIAQLALRYAPGESGIRL